jgi:calcium-dependent protein kinase
MRTLVGTPYYVAPEVLDGVYSYECDCWSLGVIMFTLLSGYLPFYGASPGEIFDKIRHGEVNFTLKEFELVSAAAKDLISKLLIKDRNSRITCT